MVIFLMKSQEILICQLRNHIRVPAGLHGIGCMRIKRIHDLPFQHIIRRRISPLHLTVHNTVNMQGIPGILHLIMPAFLFENFLFMINVGVQHRIQIHIHQILEVFIITAGHRIHRLVRISHGI